MEGKQQAKDNLTKEIDESKNKPSGPSCSMGGWRYPLDNSIGFGSIYRLQSAIHPLNNWALDLTKAKTIMLVIQRRNRDNSMLLEVLQAVEKLRLKIKQAKITKEEEETTRASLLPALCRKSLSNNEQDQFF